MTAAKTKGKLVCLICLKRFEGPDGNNQEGSNIEIPSFYDLYSRFLLVTGRYLKVVGSQRQLALMKEWRITLEKNVEAFCGQCQVIVKNMCDLYAELQVVNLKLIRRVEELEQVTRQSVKSVSTKLARNSRNSRNLFKSLVEQLNFRTIERLELFRKGHRKVKENSPQLVVPRGLLPQHCTFTYSATRLALMRLIVVFALAAAPPTNNEAEAHTEDTEGAGIVKMVVGNDFLKMDVRDKQYFEDENDVDFMDIEGDHDNDSDWSLDAGVQSSDELDFAESESLLDSESEHEFVDKDVTTSSGESSGLRKSIFGVKSNCDEDDKDNGRTGVDPDFIKARKKAAKKQQRNKGSKNAAYQECKICKKKVADLKEHHHNYFEISCAMCDFQCKWIKELRDHEKTVHPEHEEKPVQCNFCCKKLANRQSHYLHVQKAHLGARSDSSCDVEVCKKKFKTHFDLNKHLVKSHLESTEAKIEPGTGKFASTKLKSEEEDLDKRSHKEDATPPPVKIKSISYCETCDWGFVNPDLLAVHKLVHSSLNVKGYKCPVCEGTYKRVADVRKHYRSVHGNKPKRKRKAGKPRVYHRKYHRDSANLYICTEKECGRRFRQSDGLLYHLKTAHANGGRYLCSFCGARFANDWRRNQHEQLSHGQPQFECHVCHKMFRRRHHLKTHVLIHNPDQSVRCFMCSECGNVYKTPEGLRLHIRSHHTPGYQKRFTCPHCSYKQDSPYVFRKHMKTCLSNRGLPYDEEKWGKLPASASKSLGADTNLSGGRKKGRKNKGEEGEEEMEDKTTTEEEETDDNTSPGQQHQRRSVSSSLHNDENDDNANGQTKETFLSSSEPTMDNSFSQAIQQQSHQLPSFSQLSAENSNAIYDPSSTSYRYL